MNVENTTNHTNTENITFEEGTEREYAELKYLEFDIVYNEYVKKHNRVIAKLLNSSVKYNLSELSKVIVVRPEMKNGFGNRFPGIVCGFFYSLITDRLFFIEGYKNFSDYFEKDFDHNWKIVKNLYKNKNITSRYIHNRNKNNDFSLITRENLSDDSHDILYVKTWDYVCAPITSNSHYKRWFDKIIPDYRVFTAISLKLLRLHPSIDKQVETFAVNNFYDYTIGIHLRTKKLLVGMMIPVEHYILVVKNLMIGMKNMNITIFMAADTNYGRKILADSLLHTKDDMDSPNPVSDNTAGWSQKASHQRGPFVVMPVTNVYVYDDLLNVNNVWVWGAMSSEPCMYLSKSLIMNEDEETVRVFKTNPLWMHFSQCHWPV
ncbi:30183_t:CDS:2 [Gigaspora margarita]|uniref:30183_t:CDS:1 n=1 Tax=Gigaspora margarita TaxID=4874 RepID=A0ABN7VIY9_GIGMA|nr:30183_t:CDS:2 [Gigaspora margarita]